MDLGMRSIIEMWAWKGGLEGLDVRHKVYR
jgi:hypothetical protein